MAKKFLVPVILAEGSVGSPGLYFGADTATGLYRVTTNQLGISANGNHVATFYNGGVNVTGIIQASSTTDYNGQIVAQHIGSTVGSAGYFILRRARAGSTAVVNGDTLGTIIFQGHDGTGQINGPYISALVDGAVSTGIVPAALTFVVGGAERARFGSDGKFLVGMTASKFYGGAFQVGGQMSVVGATTASVSQVISASSTALDTGSPTYQLMAMYYHGATQAGNLTYCPTVANALAAEFTAVNSAAMVFTTNNAAPMVFATTGVERFRIAAAGTVTVGVKGTAGSLRLEAMDGVHEGGQITFGGAAAYDSPSIDNYQGHLRHLNASGVQWNLSSNGNIYHTLGQNALLYHDIENTNNGASAGSILRLITRNNADSGNCSVDIVKYKTGALYIVNNEPSSAGHIYLSAWGATQAQIVAVSGANQYVTLAGDVSNGPRISAGGAANANLYLSAGAGLGSLYLYTNNVGTCGMRVDHVAGASRFVVVAPHATTPSIGVSAGYLNLTSDTRCSARMSVGNVAPDPAVALYTLIGASTTGSEFGSYTQIGVSSASGSPTKYGAYHQLVSTTGYANTGLMIAALSNVTHQVTGTMTTAYANYSGSAVTAAGTITTLANYYSADVALSGGGTVGTLYGYNSAIAAGSGRWNFYASGTAPSYFGGPVKIAGTAKTDGYFDAGTTAPTNTTRLNYDGYLYATRFYGDGSQLTGVTASSSPMVVTTSEALAALDIVQVYVDGSSNIRVRKWSKNDAGISKFLKTGYVTAAFGSGASATVFLSGVISGFSGLTTNTRYFNDATTAGAISATKTRASYYLTQEFGIALSATELLFDPKLMVRVDSSCAVTKDPLHSVKETTNVGTESPWGISDRRLTNNNGSGSENALVFVYNRGRELAMYDDEHQRYHYFQQALADRDIARWLPLGNGTTITLDRFSAFTAQGTATTRNVATTNMSTKLRRLGYISAAGAGSLCGIYYPTAQWSFVQDSDVMLGIEFSVLMVNLDTVNSSRMFIGMTSSVAAPTNVDPGALTNAFGFIKKAGDTALYAYHHNGTTSTETLVLSDINTANCILKLTFSMTPNGIGRGLATQLTLAGTEVDTGDFGLNLSTNNLLYAPRIWKTNNATASAVSIDIANLQVDQYIFTKIYL